MLRFIGLIMSDSYCFFFFLNEYYLQFVKLRIHQKILKYN